MAFLFLIYCWLDPLYSLTLFFFGPDKSLSAHLVKCFGKYKVYPHEKDNRQAVVVV